MIRRLMINTIGWAGFTSLVAGIYLQYGLPPALMIGGGLGVVVSLLAALRG